MKRVFFYLIHFFLLANLLACNPIINGKTSLNLGKLSLAHSELEVANYQVAAGESVLVTLHLRDQRDQAFVSQIPVVTFSASGGTSQGYFGAVTNHGNGDYTAIFTGTMMGTAKSIRAFVDGKLIQTPLPTIEVTMGNFSLTHSEITSTQTSINSNTTAIITLRVRDSLGTQLSNGGLAVAFSHSGGTSAGTFGAVTDNNDGTYSAVFTGTTAGSATNINAAIAGQNVTSASPAITVNVGAATQLAFVQGPTAAASGTTISPDITVEALDANNNRVISYATDIVIAIHTNPSGSTLSGTLTRNPSSGVSTFNDLAINFYGNGYRLTATSGTLTAAVSALFNISATAITYDLPFTSITVPVYTTLYSSSSWSNMEFAGDLVRLTPTIQTDTAAATGTMDAGTGSGVVIGALADATNQGLKLGNGGGCDATTNDCAKLNAPEIYELSQSWTPKWNNILGYWKLNGAPGNIPTGSTIPATVGTAGTVTIAAGAPLAYSSSGKFGQSINFSGVSSATKIDVGALTSLNSIGAFSISMWFKSNVASFTGYPGLFSRGSSANRVPWIQGSTGTGRLNFLFNTPSGVWDCNVSSNTSVVVGKWTHLFATWDGTTCKIYFDATLDAFDTTTGNTLSDTDTNAMIGKQQWDSGTWNGDIDDVAVYSTALTDTEIQSIYNHQKAQYSGTFTSRIMNAKNSSAAWTTLTWFPTLPFLKELPDYSGGAVQNETSTGYSSLVGSTGLTGANNLMTGIVGLWHFNEPAGTTGAGSVKDDSGNGHHGTAESGAIFGVSGVLQKGIYASGANTAISLGVSNTLKITTGEMTLSTWIYPHAPGTYWAMGNYGGGAAYPGLVGIRIGTDYIITQFGSDDWGVSVDCPYWGNALNLKQWNNIVMTFSQTAGLAKIYSNGVELATDTTACSIGSKNFTSLFDRPEPFWVGGVPAPAYAANFTWDETALWSRTLHANEIKQLYQRGASRIKYQVRACDDNACAGESWLGPDGTSGTFFSELNNTTIPLSGSGDVKPTPPVMDWTTATANFPGVNTLVGGYFQYRTILESDSVTAALRPELKSTSVDPIHYPRFLNTDTAPENTIIGQNSIEFSDLNAFTQTLGTGGCSSDVVYNLGLSATGPWKFWNNVIWTNANGSSAQANTAASLVASSNAALTAFKVDIGRGPVYIKAFLTSDGISKCELDNIHIGGNR